MAIAAIGALGCGKAEDPRAARYRDSILLSTAPTGAVTIEDARAEIDSTDRVVLKGRIGARDMPQWWFEGSASFVVSEAMPGSHYNAGPDHDPSTCPFCRRKWKLEDSMAIVRLVDASGQDIPVTITDLLDLDEGDIVVVQGDASLDESGLLVVDSDGVYME
ncbi:MAG: hypothetical protein DWQ34_22685 [Planctomycetota bacterium]|nr:MAG: hypothetical protein DWQ34_22685 [Planctomycetota bacterium]REK30645.1 MAG: hypothetical protein DWQ41_01465 [Planctomycetota bacterium]REK33019.1 MAG: hypothetical protein DWQ45_15565 [Planctomycetota bacterium]